ncbi:MAG: hypothetical protein NW223_21660 [Hyphomicrobiaceae bacterium]|nr:hypothetical protein [Hyphomicrobiaceae bacterium]
MKSASTQDRKVREIRAILESLQRYSADGGPSAPRADNQRSGRQPAVILGGAAAVLVVLGGLGAAFFLTRGNNSKHEALSTMAPQPLQPKASPAVRPSQPVSLQTAMTHLNAGRVRVARQGLEALAGEGSADAAWALARSFDPNYLRTLDGVDAPPDVVEAKRRYRAWYDIAVKQGLVADSVSLERIIKSMD